MAMDRGMTPNAFLPILNLGNLRWRAAMVAAIALFATVGEAADMTEASSERSFYGLIQALVDAPKLDRQVVEGLTGAKLMPAAEDNPNFVSYEAHGFRLQETNVERLDYSEPVPGSDAGVGPSLSLTLHGCSIKRSRIFARYKHLKIVDQPRGIPVSGRVSQQPEENPPHDPTLEKLAFSKREPWGELSFSFDGPRANCLRTAGVVVRSPRGK